MDTCARDRRYLLVRDLAIVGAAAYAAAYVGAGARTLEFEQAGWPIWAMLLLLMGGLAGLLVAAPAIRLRGVSFVSNLGLVELCRAFALTRTRSVRPRD